MSEDFLGAVLGGNSIGIPMAAIRDVVGPQAVAPVPLAPPGILGLLNLRGRVVTAIDLHARLGLHAARPVAEPVFIVVDAGGEPYALRVDAVAEVTSVVPEEAEPVPSHLAPEWHRVAMAVYPLAAISAEGRSAGPGLMVLLNLEKLLDPMFLAAPVPRAASIHDVPEHLNKPYSWGVKIYDEDAVEAVPK